ncbi:MAG: ShlB/FhaC/HecB family hemolysin secretion/activation protein [Planctomycetota bacterium]
MNKTIYNGMFVYICIGFCCCVVGLTGEPPSRIKGLDKQQIESLDLLEDMSSRLTVREIRISGNTLISTEALLQRMPSIYNASNQPLSKAESQYLYDFRTLHDIISEPGEPREVSSRTIQGLTQYILSVYQNKNYAGIYVYVPEGVLKGGDELVGGVLLITVLEAPFMQVSTKFFDASRTEVEKGYLRRSAVENWSPVKPGAVANQKELDDFVNLLNLDPDRYVSAVVTRGSEPNTLALTYDIYEANPWHFFIQADNSGTRDRKWAPRVGVINTNLTGIDDRFTALYQAPWEKGMQDNYSLFGSYDVPLMGPKLRLNAYAGHSEYDIAPEAGLFNFLGRGSLYGAILRYNAFQMNGWFFDVTGSFRHERSKVTPTLFPMVGSDVSMNMVGTGVNLYRSDDMSNTSLGFEYIQNVAGSSQGAFWNARANAERDFAIYTTSAAHSQYIDPNKVQRISGNFRWITSYDRLVPAKMTAFGGLYSVRGYHEYEIIADNGVLASTQYEFDLVRYDQSRQTGGTGSAEAQANGTWLKKLAPLGFFDYGHATINSPVPGETPNQTLISTGVGVMVELGENFSGAVYCGWPLKSTATTNSGDARLSFSVMMRW